MDEDLCMTWNNHHSYIKSAFTSFLHKEALVDVTLAAEGRYLHVHKVVLSACSSYFASLFASNPCQHPIVILKDVQYDDLKAVVDFIYYGQVNLSEAKLEQFMKTAKMLEILELMADSSLLSNNTNESFCLGDLFTPNILQESTRSSPEPQQQSHQQPHRQQKRVPSAPRLPCPKRLRQPSTDSEYSLTQENSSIMEPPYTFESELQPTLSTEKSQEITDELLQSMANTDINSNIPTQPLDESLKVYLSQSEMTDFNETSTGGTQFLPKPHPLEDDENFNLAIEAIRFDGMEFDEAAKIYDVNRQTLWKEYNRRGYPILIQHWDSQKNQIVPRTSTPINEQNTSTETCERGSRSSSKNTIPKPIFSLIVKKPRNASKIE
ncbi:Broad-complex core protein isoforms 1/2/3/4/5 [Pseudolycoriella hygida]|uniref:Broad-complex core protein isoforms 1/2/3/4/5 n=1 Tax=Pseudolycoriella hygida TaxID=35572 RepID=A0A9Q0S1G6_9DIPT|nr:Broad-complex core protein isoforms 1/2/3/4/5 [Pseudolycoriella hygida]